MSMEFPSYLVTMPMHAITEVYGEAGLRERYHLEIQRFAPPDRARLAAALRLAGELHRDDRREREPYVNHLLRVAIRIMHHYEIADPDVITAAVLHDSVEDHPDELAGHPRATIAVAVAALADRFGDRVAGLVAAVTNPVYDPSYDKHEQYREHVRASLEREPWAR